MFPELDERIAYLKGRLRCDKGYLKNENPYPPGWRLWEVWNQGWDEQQQERKEGEDG